MKTRKAYLLHLVSHKNADDQKKEEKEWARTTATTEDIDWICRENRER
jgi:hypothetical protein